MRGKKGLGDNGSFCGTTDSYVFGLVSAELINICMHREFIQYIMILIFPTKNMQIYVIFVVGYIYFPQNSYHLP